ncbi:unnamed protein product [Rotaria sp. Silwood1]|nr:unnamed protein product [Rotaria sp. Silwood1]CAF1583251.1 unnamed protein product [Rotaria sp. Silwood1]
MIPTHIRNIIDWGMWKVYGQVEILDQKTVDDITLNADNDAYGHMTFILTIIFVCIANLLLLNVLVALFNKSFDDMKDKANNSYAYQRFLLVNEYSRKITCIPPLNLLQYLSLILQRVLACFQNKSNAIIYGPLVINNKLCWTIHNMISFNSKDQVKLDGIINKVSIHFSTAPTVSKPEICLFVMKAGIISNEFDIAEYKPLEGIMQKTGIQTFTDLNMPIDKGQYLGIRFSFEAGSPIILEGDQYCSYFDLRPHLGTKIPFTICKNRRIAMNFQVLPRGCNSSSRLLQCYRCNYFPTINEYQVLDPYVHNSFEIYDSLLFERTIANDYWKDVIDCMKKYEHDQYETNVSTTQRNT